MDGMGHSCPECPSAGGRGLGVQAWPPPFAGSELVLFVARVHCSPGEAGLRLVRFIKAGRTSVFGSYLCPGGCSRLCV